MAGDSQINVGAEMAAWVARMQGQQGGGNFPAAGLCAGMIRNADVGGGVSTRGNGLRFDATLQVTSRRPRAADTILAKLGLSGDALLQDFKKAASDAGIIYAGNVTNGPPTMSNAPISSGNSAGTSANFEIA